MKSQILKYVLAFMAQFFLITGTSCANTYRIYKTSDESFVPTESAFDDIAQAQVVILGETHYEKNVQQAEGKVLEKLSQRNPSFQLAWEFLDYRDQDQLQSSFIDFAQGKISATQWIAKWFPNSSSNHEVYLPMFEVTKNNSQKVVGTNVPRSLKQRLMNSGRSLLETDREVWPFDSQVIDAPKEYLERFEEVMGGHADTQTIQKYFLAQYYTDAYMAHAIGAKLVE
jgi:uncharacterized iron-regulated protein